MTLSRDALERLWLRLADSIDGVGPDNEQLYLSKLVLLLGNELGDEDRFMELMEAAKKHLPGGPTS